MVSLLPTLSDSGALAEMFKVETIDSDLGIIERDGYIPKTTYVLLYASGANSDSYGNHVVKEMLKNIDMIPSGTRRLSNSKQIFIDLLIPGLPAGKTVGFRFPKEY